MRMKIIERIKELQPDNWPEPLSEVEGKCFVVVWKFTEKDQLRIIQHVSDMELDIPIIEEYARHSIKHAISAYNERFPDGH